jgi:coenzyme PQQ precursor peptide PqqA
MSICASISACSDERQHAAPPHHAFVFARGPFRRLTCLGGGDFLIISGPTKTSEEHSMAWTTPVLVEICIGLEINGYLPAEF